MLIQPQVGPLATTTSLASGQQPAARAGNMGDLIVSELQARYYEATYRRALFHAANTAVTTTTVGLATAYTGLCLSNPINSTVNVSIIKVGWSLIVVQPAVASIALACGFNSGTNVTHTAAVAPHNSFFTAAYTGQALCDSSATLPTAPFYTHILGSALTGAATTVPQVSPTVVDLEGSVILPPGGYAIIAQSTVSGTNGFWGSFSWTEVPV